MSKVGDWFFEKFLNILLSGSSMILNTAPIKKKLAEVLTQKINEQIGTDSCSVSFNELKINRAKKLIKRGINFSQIVSSLGFADQRYFSRVFKSIMGMTPTEYKKTLIK